MKKEQLEEIEKFLNTLSIMEIDYFRNWLMDNYDILALNHDVDTIIETMDGVEANYKDSKRILDNIKNLSKWELDTSYFIENEKNGYYRIIEAKQIINKLSKTDFNIFLNYIKEKYPIYNNEEYEDYFLISNSFGEENFPEWDEIYGILKNELYKNIEK